MTDKELVTLMAKTWVENVEEDSMGFAYFWYEILKKIKKTEKEKKTPCQ